ncbi:MAG: GspE/PulE family protein [Acutalibacteraceae bacterium]|nr:Flp pilus assembly complex ATPase component TadA [Clostridia bacterium]MEE3403825.1 GspE/PulE family protein [Acutalibacteraceae bacterium]
MKAGNLKIGQILINSGDITEEQLEEVLEKQRNSDTKKRIADILIEDKIVTEQQVCRALEKQLFMPYVDLDTIAIPDELSGLIPEEMAQKNMVVPIEQDGRFLTVAIGDPLNYKGLKDLSITTKMKIMPVIAEPSKIAAKLREIYAAQKAIDDAKEFLESKGGKSKAQQEAEEAAKQDANANDQPIIRFVNTMIEEAIFAKCSDIHIEPMEKCLRIRFRIDGKLQIYMETSPELIPSVTSRIKFIGNMNIAEKRIPQDGRINYRVAGRDIDFRISVLPSVYGEKIVMRITTSLGMELKKEAIGFLPQNLEKFNHLIKSNRGIILVTGATGSGKSTTLYTALNEVKSEDINIITVEDPVEMLQEGITQVQTNEKAGMTFAAALRSILRQDPDIIMVGEIRDGETAAIAVQAAITGHLVLSTLHTYDAPSSVARLVDMGIEPYMVSSALLGIIAQKLARRLCVECKEAYSPDQNERISLKLDPNEEITLYRKKGCDKCNKKGYKGRIAVHEIMLLTTTLKRAITEGKSTDEVRELAVKEGMIPMKENVRIDVLKGLTSYEEFIDMTINNE